MDRAVTVASGGVTGDGLLARLGGHLIDGRFGPERSVHEVGHGRDDELLVRGQVTPAPAAPDHPDEPGLVRPLPHFAVTLVVKFTSKIGMHGSSLAPGRTFWLPTSSRFVVRPHPRHRANALSSAPRWPYLPLSLPRAGLRRLSPGQTGEIEIRTSPGPRPGAARVPSLGRGNGV